MGGRADVVSKRLLTPFGLRTLEPGHPDFKAQYFGDLRARDAAYHQGTVWAWLIGPFIDAWLRVHPGEHAAGADVSWCVRCPLERGVHRQHQRGLRRDRAARAPGLYRTGLERRRSPPLSHSCRMPTEGLVSRRSRSRCPRRRGWRHVHRLGAASSFRPPASRGAASPSRWSQQRDGYFVDEVPGARAGQRYWFQVDNAASSGSGIPVSARGCLQALRRSSIPRRSPGPMSDGAARLPRIETSSTRCTSARSRRPGRGAPRVHSCSDWRTSASRHSRSCRWRSSPGRFGWGYDGVFLFAPFHEYGTPDDARVFINDAHRLGLSVILDVVYNHLGPVGNVLPEFSDWYFAEHETDWGRGFNLDGPHSGPVREFMRANVRHWIREYHFDGLRFDAIHSMHDRSPEHIVHELTRHARAWRTSTSVHRCRERGAGRGVPRRWRRSGAWRAR